ncbi:MAG: XdhC family protein [Clostridiaceae bacterium]
MNENKIFYQALMNELNKNGRAVSAVLLDEENLGSHMILTEEKGKGYFSSRSSLDSFWAGEIEKIRVMTSTGIYETALGQMFVEISETSPHLIILGGGHVSLSMAKIGKMLDFHVTVVDDREEFALPHRFPEADEVILGSFERLFERVPEYENSYYVIVTRGHVGDKACLKNILNSTYYYVGMIGSKSKIKLTMDGLREEGIPEEKLAEIYAPIGLDLGGQLPSEIAVSIAAEIIKIKNKNKGTSIESCILNHLQKGDGNSRGILATIIEKNGSSPRGIGSKMILKEDGTILGSIGGGNVEYQALLEMGSLQETALREYVLSDKEGASLGMICGGNIKVLLEIL